MNFNINNAMPHWSASSKHFFAETDTWVDWMGHKVLAILEFIPIIGRITLLLENLHKTYRIKSLTDRKIVQEKPESSKPIPTPIACPTIEDPLALSDKEVLLCAQGLTSAAAHLTLGFNGNLLKILPIPLLGGIRFQSIIPSLFRTGISTYPTSILGIFLANYVAFSSENSNQKKDFTPEEVLKQTSWAIGPVRLAMQGALSLGQIKQAAIGIGTCVIQAGTGNSWTILRNLAVHSINIATATYNFASEAFVGAPELAYYGSFALSNTVSPEYSKTIFGEMCPGYFNPKNPKTYGEGISAAASYLFDLSKTAPGTLC